MRPGRARSGGPFPVAGGIADAARHGDGDATLEALDRTLQACTRCHATSRQEIVDHAAWQRLTARGGR